MKIVSALSWIKSNLIRNNFIEQFVEYNQNFTETNFRSANQPKPIVLFESNHAFTTHILYGLICRIKFEKGMKLVSYRPTRYRKLNDNFSFHLFSKIPLDNGINRPYRILKSMGITRFIQPKMLKQHRHLAEITYSSVLTGNKDLLLTLEVNGIRIGDIFYDWYLREQFKATIDLHSVEFKKEFIFFLCNFYWWCNYFELNNVNSVFVSHSCSDMALPARVGLKYGADTYVAAWGKMHKLELDRIFSDLEFLDYEPNSKSQFGYTIDLARAQNLLKSVRDGQIVIDAHGLGSGYIGKSSRKIIKDSKALNVLIACHCFSDPPHSYGDMLFPDFQEWLNFIGHLSLVTNYAFYIKAHPNFWESDKIIFREFLNKYPNIIEVSSDFSNIELFAQGVNVVLTVNGTIAFEAAYEEVLVINASQVSPHMNYSFTKSPKTIEEFQKMLFNLPKILETWSVNKTEVEHFFDLHHLRRQPNFLFGDATLDFYKYIGGPMQQFANPKVFDFWLNVLGKKNYEHIETRMRSFFKSQRYMLSDESN